ncbi:MAG: acyl carrier protein [Spirochaetia bacterium]
MKEPPTPIPFEQFRHLVAQELHVDESLVVPEASFVEDLFTDSIRLVELMLILGEKGIAIPFEEAWNVRTVGDAYRLYSSHAGLDASTASSAP